jgi:uncharacterized protein YjiS (DUF1127 family)
MIAKTADDARYHGSMPPATASLDAVLRPIEAMLERAWWAAWRWHQVRRTQKQLSALSDHMLRDVGLSRSTLMAATLRRVGEEEAIRRGYG